MSPIFISMVIYKATNTKTGKIYIGKYERKFNIRKSQHKHNAFIKKIDTYLYKSMRKHGFDVFKWEIIDTAETKDELNKKEIYWIKRLKSRAPNGYNMTNGGDGGTGFKHNEETRKQMSERQKNKWKNPDYRRRMVSINIGRKASPQTLKALSIAHKKRWREPGYREKMSKVFSGTPHTEETKRKISEAKKGKKMSLEARQNMSRAGKGKILSPDHRKNLSKALKGRVILPETRKKLRDANRGKGGRPIERSKDGVHWESFIGIRPAGRELGICSRQIFAVCKGERKTTRGYYWRYKV